MTNEFTLARQTSHSASATRISHRQTAGERVILVVEDDWRTRHFICTVLKYSVNAIVIESSSPRDALFVARELEYRIDLLISNIDLGDPKSGMDLAREIVGRTPWSLDWSVAGPPAGLFRTSQNVPEASAGFHRLWWPAGRCLQGGNRLLERPVHHGGKSPAMPGSPSVFPTVGEIDESHVGVQSDNPPVGAWRGGPPESNPATSVLLMSGRKTVPPCDIPPAWKFLSIPFPTAAFLNCVSELCGELDEPK